MREIYPVLTPLAVDPSHPFPVLLNKSLNLVVLLQDPKAVRRAHRMAVVQVPRSLPRILRVPEAEGPRAWVFTADIVQSNLTYYTGHGYYSDPYKPLDTRPTTRDTFAWLTRYNQYFAEPDATLQLSYRLLFDSFGSNSNAFEARWVQALPWYGISVTPAVRFYTQTAADFYKNPPFPRGYVEGQDYSADTRLASFGAITAGLVIGAPLWDGWNLALRADYYRQDPDWQVFGTGSPGIQTFSARWFQVNLTRNF